MDTVTHTEMVEAELDAFIERRSRKGESTADERNELWRESVRIYHERSEAEMRERWREYHCHMATLHGCLADEHQAKAAELQPNGHKKGDR